MRSRARCLLEERDRLERQREHYARDLKQYIRGAWHVLEPATHLVAGWHIDAISDHLEAVTRREIRNLVVNIPPGSMKSLMVSVFWQTWCWVTAPESRWLFASYAQPLSTRDSVRSRRLIESAWYQDHWGDGFSLTTDQNTKTRFENDKTGYRIAVSVGGGLGERGDVIVVDDPHSIEGSLSPVQREKALVWWDETMSQRANNAQTVVKVIIMQRLHERDLSGHVLERGGYEHLMLPMEFEPGRRCTTSLGFTDPRKAEDELLAPLRFPAEAVAEAKHNLGTYGAAGQLQQRPAPRGGGYFKESWFRWYTLDNPPKHVRKYGASDYATKEGEGDFTCHGVIGVDPDDDIYVLDWWREQTESLAWVNAAIDLMAKHKPLKWAEERGQIIGSVGPFLKKRMRERKVYCIREQFTSNRDKPTRARSIQARAESGKVYLPRDAPWVDVLVDEMVHFPASVHDDQVDVLSLFGRMLDRLIKGRVPPDPAELMAPRQPTYDEVIKMQPDDQEERQRI